MTDANDSTGPEDAARDPEEVDDAEDQRQKAAAEAAQKLVQENPAIQVSFNAMIVSYNLYMRATDLIANCVAEDNIEDGPAILQILQLSVTERARSNPMQPAEIQQQLLEVSIPYLDLLDQRVQHLKQAGAHNRTKPHDDRNDSAGDTGG